MIPNGKRIVNETSRAKISRKRRPIGCFVWLMLVGCLFSLDVSAQPGISVDGALKSHFVDRGELVVDAPVLQAEVDVVFDGFSFQVWGNLDLTDENEHALEITEAELTLAYGVTLHPLDATIGVGQSLFSDESATREIFAHLAMLLPLTPSLGVYHDIDEIEGTYIDFDVHHVFEVTPVVSLETRGSLGYGDAAANDDAFQYDKDALRDLNASAAFLFYLDRHSMLSIGGRYWRLVDADLRDTVKAGGGTAEGVVWNLSVHRSF